MARRLSVAVALLVVLAGCAGLPGSESPAPPVYDLSIAVSNADDRDYLLRVTAIPPEIAGIEVTYENGTTRRFEVSSFDAVPRIGLRNATAIGTTGAEARSEEFVIGPAEGIGATMEDLPANATIVYFVLSTDGPDANRGAGVVRCASETENVVLEITVRPDGSLHSSVTCGDDPE